MVQTPNWGILEEGPRGVATGGLKKVVNDPQRLVEGLFIASASALAASRARGGCVSAEQES